MLRFLKTVTLLLILMISSAKAQIAVELVPLAESVISYNSNRIDIEASLFSRQDYDRGVRFRSLQFQAERTSIFLDRIEICYYSGGCIDYIPVGTPIRPGRPLDVLLPEPRSYIQYFRIYTQSFSGQAPLRIYGVPTRRDEGIPFPEPGPWVQLGCFTVDVFEVSAQRRERLGSYRTIKLSVIDYPVRIQTLRINYVGGLSDVLIDAPNGRLFNVGESPEMRLNTEQNIDEIRLEADVDERQGDVKSRVCVFGQRWLR